MDLKARVERCGWGSRRSLAVAVDSSEACNTPGVPPDAADYGVLDKGAVSAGSGRGVRGRPWQVGGGCLAMAARVP